MREGQTNRSERKVKEEREMVGTGSPLSFFLPPSPNPGLRPGARCRGRWLVPSPWKLRATDPAADAVRASRRSRPSREVGARPRERRPGSARLAGLEEGTGRRRVLPRSLAARARRPLPSGGARSRCAAA